jgi:hypothetical protein
MRWLDGSVIEPHSLELLPYKPDAQYAVILLSSNILVLTVSTVMVGPPDFSITRSPDLITAIGTIQVQLSESSLVAPQQ